jgi:hypothetical protein
MAVALKRRRFNVDEYEQMGRVGILGEDDRGELLDGEIVEMTPIGRRHASCVARLTQHFAAQSLSVMRLLLPLTQASETPELGTHDILLP